MKSAKFILQITIEVLLDPLKPNEDKWKQKNGSVEQNGSLWSEYKSQKLFLDKKHQTKIENFPKLREFSCRHPLFERFGVRKYL